MHDKDFKAAAFTVFGYAVPAPAVVLFVTICGWGVYLAWQDQISTKAADDAISDKLVEAIANSNKADSALAVKLASISAHLNEIDRRQLRHIDKPAHEDAAINIKAIETILTSQTKILDRIITRLDNSARELKRQNKS